MTLTPERKQQLLDDLAEKYITDLIKLYDDATITSTDRATIWRFLQSSGVTFDPTLLPKSIRDRLPSGLPKFDDEALDRPNLKVVG